MRKHPCFPERDPCSGEIAVVYRNVYVRAGLRNGAGFFLKGTLPAAGRTEKEDHFIHSGADDRSEDYKGYAFLTGFLKERK